MEALFEKKQAVYHLIEHQIGEHRRIEAFGRFKNGYED
jgi:hypothetical protein